MRGSWSAALIAPALVVAAALPPAAEARPQEASEAGAVAAVEVYDDVYEEYLDARSVWIAKIGVYRERMDAGETDLVWPTPPETDIFPRMWTLAQLGDPNAVFWCLGAWDHSPLPPDRRLVAKLRLYLDLIGHYAFDEGLGQRLVGSLCGEIGDYEGNLGRRYAFALLEELGALNPAPAFQAQLLYSKASALEWSNVDGDEELATLLFRTFLHDYPEHEYAPRARGKIFRIERLQVGMRVPDIVGKDVDGKPLKLSDYAGHVAVIDFWGFW